MFGSHVLWDVRPVEDHFVYEGVDATVNCLRVPDDDLSVRVQLDPVRHEVVALGVEASEDHVVPCHEGESVKRDRLEGSPRSSASGTLAVVKS